MNPPLAFNPEWNVRVFAAGIPASARAAFAWMDGHTPAALGPVNALLDGVKASFLAGMDPELRAGSACEYRGRDRVWVSGSPARLVAVSAAMQAAGLTLGMELEAALRGFEAGLNHPPRTLIMGILNVTPDSFSDGGQWSDPVAAVDRGLRMLAEGADVLDIGGESTRPGAAEIPADEELRRVLPVVRELRAQTGAPLSIDTRKAAVARPCLDAGADWINDVSGLRHDPELARAAAEKPGTRLVLMHSRARPDEDRYSTEYDATGHPVYEDVVADTMRWLRRQLRVALDAGVAAEGLWIDPGFGFGKTPDQNVELLRRLREYTSIGLPVLVGTSRKSTVGRLLGDLPPDQRLEGTAATVTWAIGQGAAGVRVHDVREMARVARVADALR